MTNKKRIVAHLKDLDMILTSYDSRIDKLTKKATNELIDSIIGHDSTDVALRIRNVWYVVEVACIGIDNVCEVDMALYTKNQYLEKYGEEYEYKFE